MTMQTPRRVRWNDANSSASRGFDAGAPDPAAHLDPTAFPSSGQLDEQRLVKDGNDHNISEIG
jgi:hypothetical protein